MILGLSWDICGRVYTKIISDASSETLILIINRKVIPDSIVYSDSWKAYTVLDVSDFTHFRINHFDPFANKKNHINGIENFWIQAKRHMQIQRCPEGSIRPIFEGM